MYFFFGIIILSYNHIYIFSLISLDYKRVVTLPWLIIITEACSWRSDSTRCYPGYCDGELAENCRCVQGFTGTHCEKSKKKHRNNTVITEDAPVIYNKEKVVLPYP